MTTKASQFFSIAFVLVFTAAIITHVAHAASGKKHTGKAKVQPKATNGLIWEGSSGGFDIGWRELSITAKGAHDGKRLVVFEGPKPSSCLRTKTK